MKWLTFKRKRLSKVQKNSRYYLIKRGAWYLLGLILFFAPLALFNRGLNLLVGLLSDAPGRGTVGSIHGTCLRMPIGDLLSGKGLDLLSVWGVSVVLLLGSAFLIGPFFCGRLCATGAFTEYLSRLWPDKWKIDWSRMVNPVPVRYGFLVGFVVAPMVTGSVSCGFCGYGFFERMLTGGFWGDVGVMSSTVILTGFLWFIVFGIFTKGGRGYCNFMCPVGAVQSFLHSLGAMFGFTYKLKYDKKKCISCSSCVNACPMGALRKAEEGKIKYNIHNCITCRQCTAACPTSAICYGKGERGWDRELNPQAPLNDLSSEKGAL